MVKEELKMMKELEFVNLTPHALNIKDMEGKIITIEPYGLIARVSTEQVQVGEINGTAIYKTQFGDIVDLPEPKEGIIYIVSKITQSAAKERTDLLSPGNLSRDDEGNIIGCEGLTY